MPYLSNIKPHPHFKHRRKRVGRGPGSGIGKTSGRGHKGQKARGPGARIGFEGGQMPIIRIIPKRGFTFLAVPRYQIVNIEKLNNLKTKETLDPQLMWDKRLIRRKLMPVKVLGDGELKSPLQVKAHAFSRKAKAKIEKAGGKIELIKPGLEKNESKS